MLLLFWGGKQHFGEVNLRTGACPLLPSKRGEVCRSLANRGCFRGRLGKKDMKNSDGGREAG